MNGMQPWESTKSLRSTKSVLFMAALILSTRTLMAQEKSSPQELPVNRWVKLATDDTSAGYSWSSPVYVPARGQVLHWGTVANAGREQSGRNDVRALDALKQQ